MRRDLRGAVLVFVLAAAHPGSSAGAHEFWLAPSTYRAGVGDTLTVAAFVGTGFRGDRVPYAATRTVRFDLRARRALDLGKAGMNGSLTFARWIVGEGDGAMVAYQSDFMAIELPAAEFDHYLALEGLDGPRAARARLGGRAGPGRERFSRCAKLWIAGTAGRGGTAKAAPRALEPVGLPLEIVPLADPGGAQERLAVRVLWRGRPLADALVRVWYRPLASHWSPSDPAARDSVGAATESRAGRDGVATLRITAPGECLLSVVHMVPSAERSSADWDSYWASLTFAR